MTTREVVLNPGVREAWVTVRLPLRGDSCRHALPSGKYQVVIEQKFAMPEGVRACGKTWDEIEVPDVGQVAKPKHVPREPPADCGPRPVCAYACTRGFPVTSDARGCPICGCSDEWGVTVEPTRE